MAIPITGNQNFPTKNQIPDHSIMDHYDKQAYLGNQFTYAAATTIAGTSETVYYLFTNPAGNSVSMFFNYRKAIAQTSSHSVVINLYSAPTFSANGTAKTPVNVRTASSNTSKINLYLTPTVSVNGTLVESLSASNPVPDVSQRLFILDPGKSMLITVTASNASDVVAMNFGWFEI